MNAARIPHAATALLLLALSSGGLTGCAAEDRPKGWSERTHGNDAAADYDRLFDTEVVHRIDIELSAENFEKMESDRPIAVAAERDPAWVEATVHHDDRTWPHVGIRYKGTGTIEDAMDRGSRKFPFRITFDQYEDDHPIIKNQRFYGFKKLTFSSNEGDDSFLRDVLAGEIFRDHGVPAARGAFYRVFVDVGEGPEYWGLYTMIEDPDDAAMLKSQLGGADGNLYKPEGPSADWTSFDEASFPKKRNADGGDPGDFSDVKGAIEALNDDSVSGADFRSALEERLDVDGFLRFLAVNTAIVNWDSYGCKARNYFLYGDSGRITWVPWDLNESLSGGTALCGTAGGAADDTADDLYHAAVGENWPLIAKLLADDEYRTQYGMYLNDALEGTFAVDTFSDRAKELHALIEPYVTGDDGEQEHYSSLTSKEAFEESVTGDAGFIAHVEARHQVIEAAASDN